MCEDQSSGPEVGTELGGKVDGLCYWVSMISRVQIEVMLISILNIAQPFEQRSLTLPYTLS